MVRQRKISVAHIELRDARAARAQRLRHASRGRQRNLALRPRPAFQNNDVRPGNHDFRKDASTRNPGGTGVPPVGDGVLAVANFSRDADAEKTVTKTKSSLPRDAAT